MSRNSDPFPLVKGEVEKSIAGVAQLYERWQELADSPQDASDEFAFLTGELKTGLKSIEWDLQDLEETISIVQRQNKFGISEAELFEREQFVRSTRDRVSSIRDHLGKAQALAESGNATRYMHDSLVSGGSAKQDRFSALDAAIEEDNRQFVQAHQQMQDDMYEDQEDGLKELSVAFGTLHHMGEQMHDELSRQEKMLQETEENIDKTSTRVGRAIRRTDDLLNKSKGNWGWIIIALLVVALMVTFILILVL